MPSSPPGEGMSRVPLRRLSTKRFKTLQARNEDNARRRLKRAVEKRGGDWDRYKAQKQEGRSWVRLDSIESRRQDLERRYLAGEDLGDDGIQLRRDIEAQGLPPEVGFYRKHFG